jgi:hypothetical protein
MRRPLIALLLAVAAVAIWLAVRARGDRPSAPAPATAVASGATTPPAASGSAAAARPPVRKLPDPSRRAALLEAIRDAARKRSSSPSAAGGAGATSTTPPPALPEGDAAKDYIRTSVRALIPLLVECYNEALERDPELAGKLIVEFTIEGEPEVGGVIGDSAIDDAGSTIRDATMRECIQQTMYAIEIDPPAGGGVVNVRYPFEFSNNR